MGTDEQNLWVIYSNFSKTLPYTWSNKIIFLPTSYNQKNVTPWGQTDDTPIFNITWDNYLENASL